jgi:hypothetical protein
VSDPAQQLVTEEVSECVVNQLEAVDVDEQHRQSSAMALRECQRARQPIGQQQAIRQVGQLVVAGKVGHAQGQSANGADVSQHDPRTDDPSRLVMNGGGRMLDRTFHAVAAQQRARAEQVRVWGLGRRPLELQGGALARRQVDDLQHLAERPAGGLEQGPSGHRFSGGIHVGDSAGHIGADQAVADEAQGGADPFRFGDNGFTGRLALNSPANRVRQPIAIEPIGQQVVAGPRFESLPRGLCTIVGTDDQDRDPWSGLPQSVQSRDE